MLLLPVTVASQTGKFCIHWPTIYAKEAVRRLPPGKPVIVIQPITNGSKQKMDEWLSHGLSELLIRYLSTQKEYGILSSRYQKHLDPKKIAYQVGGVFQRGPGWLRVFTTLKDAQGKVIGQFPMETPYPLHNRFFAGLNEGAQKILGQIGKIKIRTHEMNRIQDETNSVRAYENYSKGMETLYTYDPHQMEVAFIWFQQAIQEDRSFFQPYFGLTEAYGFLGVHNRQAKENYREQYEAVENIEAMLKKEFGRNKEKKSKGPVWESRYLRGYANYTTGISILQRGKAAKALPYLERAREAVPEDPATAYSLAHVYAKLGKRQSAEEVQQWIREMNACAK